MPGWCYLASITTLQNFVISGLYINNSNKLVKRFGRPVYPKKPCHSVIPNWWVIDCRPASVNYPRHSADLVWYYPYLAPIDIACMSLMHIQEPPNLADIQFRRIDLNRPIDERCFMGAFWNPIGGFIVNDRRLSKKEVAALKRNWSTNPQLPFSKLRRWWKEITIVVLTLFR